MIYFSVALRDLYKTLPLLELCMKCLYYLKRQTTGPGGDSSVRKGLVSQTQGPQFSVQNHVKHVGVVVHDCNSSVREVEIGANLGTGLIGVLQASKRPILKELYSMPENGIQGMVSTQALRHT